MANRGTGGVMSNDISVAVPVGTFATVCGWLMEYEISVLLGTYTP